MKKKYNAFSLMEMMVVLLIVAIVAAASAPMINKKVTSLQGDGDCLWTDENAGISYNSGQANGLAVMIGASDRSVTNTSLYIASRNNNFISFDDNSRNPISIKANPTISTFAINSTNTTLQDNAVAIGYDAEALEQGTAIGQGAKAGSFCTAIGRNADAGDDGNIAIGTGARVTAASGSIAIGNGVQATADHQIVLGGPNDTVWIRGNLRVDQRTELGGQNTHTAVIFDRTNNNYFLIQRDATGSLFTQTVPQVLESDRRLKNVGEKFTSGLEDLNKLELFNYTYKKDEAKTPHVGVMAQDLMKIFPNAVLKGEDGYYRIRMEDMFYSAINAIKELDLKITEIKEQIKAFVDRVTTIETSVKELKTTVEAQQKSIDAQQKMIETQQKTIEAQQKAIDDLAKKVEKISKKKAAEEAKAEAKAETKTEE